MSQVPSKGPLAGGGIVGISDLGQEQQARTIERPRSHDHDVGGLQRFGAVGIDMAQSNRLAVLVDNPPHRAAGPDGEVFLLGEDRHQDIGGLRLGADHTAIA